MQKQQRRAGAGLLNFDLHAPHIKDLVHWLAHSSSLFVRPKASLTPFGKVALDISCHCPLRKSAVA
jgi:hypothetical protein